VALTLVCFQSSKVVKKKVSGKAVEVVSQQVKKASGKAVKLSDSTSSEESQTGSSSGSSSPPQEELLPGEVRKTAQVQSFPRRKISHLTVETKFTIEATTACLFN